MSFIFTTLLFIIQGKFTRTDYYFREYVNREDCFQLAINLIQNDDKNLEIQNIELTRIFISRLIKAKIRCPSGGVFSELKVKEPQKPFFYGDFKFDLEMKCSYHGYYRHLVHPRFFNIQGGGYLASLCVYEQKVFADLTEFWFSSKKFTHRFNDE